MLLMSINAPSQRNLLLNLKIIFAWTLNDISPKSIIVIGEIITVDITAYLPFGNRVVIRK